MRRLMVGLVTGGLWVAAAAAQSVSIGEMRFDFGDPALAAKDAAQQAFVTAFRAAKASRDPARMAQLVHPASRACLTPPVSKAYFDERLQRDVSSALPDDAKIVFITRDKYGAAFDQLAARGDLTSLPVQPTDLIGIDYEREERDGKGVLLKHVGNTIVRQLARHEGKLMMVEYCLTARGEEAFAKKANQARPAKP